MYDEKKVRKAQLVMLELLEVIDKICEENNLVYWLDSGTLLGAARHKGFIPWDDDLDICVPRESYEKLIEILKEKNDKYFLQTYDTDKYAESGFAKLRSRNNILKIHKDEKGHTGVFIDIFPVDCYSKSDSEFIMLKKKLVNKTLFFWMKKAKYKSPFIKNLKGNLVKFIAKIYFGINKNYDSSKLMKSILEESNKVKLNQEGDKYDYGLEVPFYLNIDKSIIFPLKKIKFENKDFYVPNKEDIYLKQLYGDYMKLPKEEDRKPSHCYEMHININKEKYNELNKNY